MKLYSNGKLRALPSNIRQRDSLTNNLAYYDTKLITKIKSFGDTNVKLYSNDKLLALPSNIRLGVKVTVID